jgi:LPS-assembly lipoprotein
MWWLERCANVSRYVRIALTLAMAGLVTGCFQPLYASRSVSGGSLVAEQLRSVDVAPINVASGTPEARLAAELRNMMIFELTGGAAKGAPTHRLTMHMSSLRQQVIIDITTSRPDVEQAGVNISYSLVEIASGRVVVSGQTFSRVSYDNPGQEQRFARARGRMDAENRAAKVVTENIRSRLASYFIAGT